MSQIILNPEERMQNGSKPLQRFAKRPAPSKFGRPISLQTNCYKLQGTASQTVHKYSIAIEPEVTVKTKLMGQVIKACETELKEKFGEANRKFYGNLYALTLITDEVEVKKTVDDQEYTLKVVYSKHLEPTDSEYFSFQKNLYTSFMRKLEFEKIGRSCFNPKAAEQIESNLSLWPGFYSAMTNLEAGPMMQIDMSTKCVRKDKVLDHIEQILQRRDRDQCQEEFKGAAVVTSYSKVGKHIYKVDRIDFEKSPQDTFEKKTGETISFAEYFEKQYSQKIRRMDQPLLVVKETKSDREIYLVPELCEMTGLTDDMRKNFGLMKRIKEKSSKDAQTKSQEIKNLIKCMERMEGVKELQKKWQFSLNQDAIQIEGQQLSSGNVIMGEKVQPFPADCDQNTFDRKTQARMQKPKDFNKWCVITTKYMEKEYNVFQQNMDKVFQSVGFKASRPAKFVIDGNDGDARNWERVCKDRIQRDVDFVVFLLPGKKKAGKCYKQIKQMMTEKFPVPNQVILGSTLMGRNTFSICHKVLIQMNAKAGGECWGISNMPYCDAPTMVLGVSSSKFKGGKTVFSISATINRHFNRFFSKSKLEQSSGACSGLLPLLKEAFTSFKNTCQTYPKRLIVLRDGVSDSQKSVLMDVEIPQIRSAIAAFEEMSECKLLYANVVAGSKMKFSENKNGRLSNPPPGTIIDSQVIKAEEFSFYMISTQCRQGQPSPTHVSVLVDDIASDSSNLKNLLYKLCYLYFNFSGSVKMPAPIKYANAQAKFLADLDYPEVHEHYDRIRGLTYI